MSGYIKELMLDYALRRLNEETRYDLSMAIEQAFKSGVFTYQDLQILDMYLSGYTSIEIAAKLLYVTEQIKTTLSRIFMAIATYSGYDDAILIRKVERDKQYRRSGIRELQDFLSDHGQQFVTHDIKGI